MRILIISPKNKTVFNFRGDLIKDMISNHHEIYVTGPNDDFLGDIYALGVKRFIKIPLIKDNTSLIDDIRYCFKLIKAIKRIKPDMVFSYTAKPVIYGSLSAKLAKVPKIYAMVTGLGRAYSSNTVKAKIVKTIMNCLYRLAFICCDKVIFQNKDDLAEFFERDDDKAVIVNGSGVNMNRFKRTPLPNKPVFLMISRIMKEKGVLDFCNAAKIVKKRYPESKFILLGGFDKSIGALRKEDIQSFIDDDIIEFPGEVKEPVDFYNKSSVYVLPSYYREGLPRTILEAMSCGRPVITTNWVGCREPIIEGVNGFLVPIKDVNALVQKIQYFIENPDSIAYFGEQAYLTCKDKYDVYAVNKKMQSILGY